MSQTKIYRAVSDVKVAIEDSNNPIVQKGMYVCMYVWTYVRRYVCMCGWMDGWIDGRMCMYKAIDACRYANVWECVDVNRCIYVLIGSYFLEWRKKKFSLNENNTKE